MFSIRQITAYGNNNQNRDRTCILAISWYLFLKYLFKIQHIYHVLFLVAEHPVGNPRNLF